MEARTKAMVSFVILIFLIGGLYIFTGWFSKVTGYALGEDEKVKLSLCLDGKNTVLYTSATCPSCENQLDIFGETAAEFLDVVVCDNVDEKPCSDLKGVPAWKINGEFYYGTKNFEELSDISGCDMG